MELFVCLFAVCVAADKISRPRRARARAKSGKLDVRRRVSNEARVSVTIDPENGAQIDLNVLQAFCKHTRTHRHERVVKTDARRRLIARARAPR